MPEACGLMPLSLQPVSDQGGELASFGPAFRELHGAAHYITHVPHARGLGVVHGRFDEFF